MSPRHRHPKKEQSTQAEKGFYDVKLTVAERLVLSSILPTEESYSGMTEISRLKTHLGFSGEEAQQIDLVQDTSGVKWDPVKGNQLIKDVPMGEWVTNIIREILRKKSEQHKLLEREMSLYEKFVVDYGLV